MTLEAFEKLLSRRQFVSLLSGSAVAVAAGGLAGCGGSGGSGSSAGGGTGGSGDLGLGTITPAAAAAATGSARDFAASLPALDLATTQQRVASYIQTQKEFVHSGTNPGSVWGLLPNGAVYTIFLNRYPKQGENTGIDSGRAAPTRGTDLPSGTLAALLENAMGAGFRNEAGVIQPSVNEKQYVAHTGGAGIEELRSLGAPGFFYLSAHGDQTAVPRLANNKFVLGSDGKPIMDKAFAVSTTTPYNPATMNQYAAEILLGEVGAGGCLENIQGGKGIYADRLLITTRWVAHYWTFSKDSLIWISACSSNGPISQDFVQACLAKAGNAALYVGWSDFTEGDHAVQVSKFVIDRLLGTNKLDPIESPPQRSFDFVTVYNDLRKRGLNSRPTLNPATSAAFVGRTTEVIFTQGNASQFGLLAPSISRVLIDEQHDQAILKGIFGMPPESDRAVLIGGLECKVASWAADTVVVALPRTGSGSSGDVVASVRAHTSNTRQITEWDFALQYLYSFVEHPTQVVNGTNLKLRFRADVGDYRDLPGADPKTVVRGAVPVADAVGPLAATGAYTDGGTTYEWSGKTSLTTDYSQASTANILVSALTIDTKTKQANLGVAFGAPDPKWFTLTTTDSNGLKTTTQFPVAALLDGATAFVDPTEQASPFVQLSAFPLTFNQDYTLAAGNVDKKYADLHIKWSWDAVTPISPPDPKAARSVRR